MEFPAMGSSGFVNAAVLDPRRGDVVGNTFPLEGFLVVCCSDLKFDLFLVSAIFGKVILISDFSISSISLRLFAPRKFNMGFKKDYLL